MFIGFGVRVSGRTMDYSGCLLADQLPYRATAAADMNAVKVDNANVDDDEADYQNDENGVPVDGHSVTNADEASIIDEYFGLHDITTTSGSGDVIGSEIPRAYDAEDAHWLSQSTTAPISASAVTSQPRLFASGEDVRNRKYYDFVPSADFVDLGPYITSGMEARPPPCYPTKREDKLDETGNTSRANKLYTGSYSTADAYIAQYGAGAFPVIIDQGQYGSGLATGSVLNDGRQQYYLSANGTPTGNGSSCAGYLSVDVGGFGPTMLRSLGYQSSTTAWPAALRQ